MLETLAVTTDPQEKLYQGFGCPHEDFDFGYMESFSVRHTRRFMRAFLNRYGKELDQYGSGLTGLFSSWLKQETNFHTIWDVSFSQLRNQLAITPGETEKFLRWSAAAGLRLHEQGINGAWHLRLAEPTWLRWGRWLLPEADYIEVEATSGHASISLGCKGNSHKVQLWQTAEGWQAEGAEKLPQLDFDGQPITLLSSTACESKEFEDAGAVLEGELLDTIMSKYGAAIELVHSHAPLYGPWNKRVIRQIIPTLTAPGIKVGGSNIHNFGAIQMCINEPLVLAGIMAHEATHQHYHLLSIAGPLDNGLDETDYVSPVKNAPRSIRLIAVAYHAFANELLFYRMCRDNGFKDEALYSHLEGYILPKLEVMEDMLRTSTGLTALGRAMWEPMAPRLR
jgi:HEXXH motif-containing protein